MPNIAGFISGPEVWNKDLSLASKKTDMVWFLVNKFGIDVPNYARGYPVPTHMHEGKAWGKVSLQVLIDDQVFKEAEGLCVNNKIWVICNRGLEICIFRFDLTRFVYPGASSTFDHFQALNLNNWSEEIFNKKGIKVVVESIDATTDVIQVIQWRLDNRKHHRYIHDMLVYIANNGV